MRLIPALFYHSVGAGLLFVLSHFITYVPGYWPSVSTIQWTTAGVTIVFAISALLLGRHEFAYPRAWIHRSKIPYAILLVLEVGAVAAFAVSTRS
ncbi:MAG: hypothetical protein ACI9X4_000140 [Glaciecola sp.]|jgi:hypothetical protein